jgi:elongation factor G
MKMEVITPKKHGDIVGDINRRRGQVNDMGDRAGAKTIKADVPLSEMSGYVTTLRTLSSGRATSTMEFSHYAETPSNISEAVIKSKRKRSKKMSQNKTKILRSHVSRCLLRRL